MKKNIISLHGSYFGNNYGDILLVSIFADWIKSINTDCILNFPLANKNKTKELPAGKTGIYNLIKSKCLIYCGGGYFGEQPKNKKKWALRNFFRHGVIGIIAIILNIPYAIIGVEFGPISEKWFRFICITIAKHAKLIVVRNAESRQFLESFGVKNVHQTADAVLALSEQITVCKKRNNEEILLHIPGITAHKTQILEICIQLQKILAIEKKYSVAFIHDDYENIYNTDLYDSIIREFKEKKIPFKIYEYRGYKELIEIINTHSYIITTKLHVGITAASLNIRPLSFWLHPKTMRLHKQIDNSHYCNSLDDTSTFYETINNYLNQNTSYNLPQFVRNAAIENKIYLDSFLKSIV